MLENRISLYANASSANTAYAHLRIAAILALVRNESKSRNTLYRHSTTSCTCVRRYYLHLHNEQYVEILLLVASFFLSLSSSLVRVDVLRHVSHIRLWEPIQPRFVNERRMNEAPRTSSIRPSIRSSVRPAGSYVSPFKSTLSTKHMPHVTTIGYAKCVRKQKIYIYIL